MEYRITGSSCEDYKKQLKNIPIEMQEVCERLNKARERLDLAESRLEEFSYGLSSDITINPSKHGFLLGDKPERFRILSRVKSHPEFKQLTDEVNYYKNQVRIETENKEIIRMKFEALRCLLAQ